MAFDLQYYYNGFFPYFVFEDKVDEAGIKEFLRVLQTLIDLKQPFVFVVDVRKVNNFPVKAGIMVVKWMKKNKPKIPGIILGSAVVLENKKLAAVFRWTFERQTPVSPNYLGTDIQKGIKFVEDKIPNEIRQQEQCSVSD